MSLRLVVLTLSILAALARPHVLEAQCDCDSGDGVFTTHTGVTIDGLFLDWAVIHADDDNNACDGGGLTVAPQPDLDYPVQSTGRDLVHFAYTWDDTHVQAYTERMASTSNVQRFIYYADTDNDGTMDTGERVIVAAWKGSNRRVELFLGTYQQATAGGDPMVDGGGFADGYTLPGTVVGLPSTGNPDYSGTWGNTDGLSMEWEVPWVDAPGAPGLGIPAGAAFTFHISATNSNPQASSFPAQVDDNMAGCGGGPGSHQHAGLSFEPDRSTSVSPGSTVYLSHWIVNQGNGADHFDLAASSAGTFTPTVSFFHDLDANGSFSPGDTLLSDATGNGDADIGAIAAGDTAWVLIAYAIPGGANGSAVVTTEAISDFDDRFADSVVDTLTYSPPLLAVTKTSAPFSDPINDEVRPKAIPLAYVDYLITATNSGSGTAVGDSVTISDRLPSGVDLFVGDLGGGIGPVDVDDGTPATGLDYVYNGVDDPTDGLDFSIDWGNTWDYEPDPDTEGFDPLITDVRVRLAGPLNGSGPSGIPT